ncbi:MAG: hypothetical protein EHM77_06735 [Planctomycetaceae bacterium]|nr:MAG: hypothetical protein EHM77_06735 [Planctomycetaceae bacterium]
MREGTGGKGERGGGRDKGEGEWERDRVRGQTGRGEEEEKGKGEEEHVEPLTNLPEGFKYGFKFAKIFKCQGDCSRPPPPLPRINVFQEARGFFKHGSNVVT